MGINDLQQFLQGASLEGGSVSVDLLKIARNVSQRQQPHNAHRKIRPIGNKLKLIVDAENCLDRLYGGYFSDWACGGQWNRMIQFLSLLTRAVERGNIELAVAFNGTIEACRMDEWIAEQANVRQKVGMVLKHVNTKATPPPKVWWTSPTCLRSALRMALRHLGITVMCTMDDHHQEVIAYCRESGFHGLLADDAEYAAFDPPRYFSSEHLKLTYKGSLETKEYMISELTKTLQLTQEQLCVMSALMGNFLLTENDLSDFHKRIGITNTMRDNIPAYEANVRLISEYVRTLPPTSNIDALVSTVLGSADDKRTAKLRQSIQYYLNGTANGFLKYCAPPTVAVNANNSNKNGGFVDNCKKSHFNLENNNRGSDKAEFETLVEFASETTEQEQETLENYKLATVNSVLAADLDLEQNGAILSDTNPFNGIINGANATNAEPNQTQPKVNIFLSSSSSNTSSVPSSPKHVTTSTQPTNTSTSNFVTPSVSSDVLRTASLRHQKGLMASTILHVLSTQEVRLPCLMEDESNREFPPIHDIYQPLRRRVYAVLFNLHHLRYVHAKRKDAGDQPENSNQQPPEVIVTEWKYSRSNPFQSAEEVRAEPLPWAVPTLQRLWFGPALDDKRRRMRALLSCMNSDTPLILNTGYVPQHMLIMACVLRYIMAQDRAIMRKHELDAFLCQAFNADLMNPQYLQELTLNVVTTRGVQLAALFMQGVEMALLANDACGAPLPWLMCCPWLYFDGKLFHYTLNRSAHSKNLLEVCENHIERVVKVERMRKAVLEGVDVKFAKMPLPPPFTSGTPGMMGHRPPPQQSTGMTNLINISNLQSTSGGLLQGLPLPGPPHRGLPAAPMAAGGRPRGPMSSRGGQLQIAGVVVGSWGANYGYQSGMRAQPPHHQPHVPMHAGYMGGGGAYQGRGRAPQNANGFYQQTHHHQQTLPRGRGGPARKNNGNVGGGGGGGGGGNRRNNNVNKKRNNTNKKNQVVVQPEHHILTVRTENGDIPVDELILKEGAPDKNEDCKANEHKGQGDAPNVVN